MYANINIYNLFKSQYLGDYNDYKIYWPHDESEFLLQFSHLPRRRMLSQLLG